MHFFIKDFKFKFTDSSTEQQCTFTLQSFTNCSQHKIVKIKAKTVESPHHKHKFKKLKKLKNNQSDAA